MGCKACDSGRRDLRRFDVSPGVVKVDLHHFPAESTKSLSVFWTCSGIVVIVVWTPVG